MYASVETHCLMRIAFAAGPRAALSLYRHWHAFGKRPRPLPTADSYHGARYPKSTNRHCTGSKRDSRLTHDHQAFSTVTRMHSLPTHE